MPASSTSLAFARALSTLGHTRVSVLAPYPEAASRAFVAFLAEWGIEVDGFLWLDALNGFDSALIPAEAILRAARETDRRTAEALVIPDTALSTMSIVSELERVLGKTVLTANQVTIWEALRLAGSSLTVADHGRLLATAPSGMLAMTVPKAPAFSVPEYRRRLVAVQQGLAERDLDGLVLFSPGNINYLTGMDSENLFDIQACILARDGDPSVVLFDFERGRFDNSAWLAEPVAYGPFEDPITAVVEELRRRGLDRGRLGIEQRQAGLSPQHFLRLQAALPTAKVEDAFGPVERMRLVKSEEEIALMRRAAAFTDERRPGRLRGDRLRRSRRQRRRRRGGRDVPGG